MSLAPTPVKAALDRCLDWAIAHDNYFAVQPWLDAGAMPNPEPALLNECLLSAIDTDNLVCAEWLLAAGADPNAQTESGDWFINQVTSKPMVELLIEHGAVLDRSYGEASRLLLSLVAEHDSSLITCSAADFAQHRNPRYGSYNGEEVTSPFHVSMIESGESAYGAGEHFKFDRSFNEPEWKHIWNVARFGQSTTLLPDGRYVQIGGEHEDYYDPDFFIYNDVVVHTLPSAPGEPWQRQVFAYPREIFPPTDNHSATLVGEDIIVIGNLGYSDERIEGHTPVYALHWPSMQFRELTSHGPAPGWIHKHQAKLVRPGVIALQEGSIYRAPNHYAANGNTWELDLGSLCWTRVE